MSKTIKSIEQLRQEFDEKFPVGKVAKKPQLQSILNFLQENIDVERVTPKPYMRHLLRSHLGYTNDVVATYKSSAA